MYCVIDILELNSTNKHDGKMDLYIKSLWLGKLNNTFLLFPFKFKDTKRKIQI